jgi:hypothetical protein
LEFKVEPTAKKSNENRCDVSYLSNSALFQVEVRGKNFPDAKLGADGGGLKKEMNGCGSISGWKFIWTPNDVAYQWYAYVLLPLGMKKGCPGRAVVSAGGTECDC